MTEHPAGSDERQEYRMTFVISEVRETETGSNG